MSILSRLRHFKILSIKTRDAPARCMPGPVRPTRPIPPPPPPRHRLRVAETLEGSEVINRIAREQDGAIRVCELDQGTSVTEVRDALARRPPGKLEPCVGCGGLKLHKPSCHFIAQARALADKPLVEPSDVQGGW